MSEPKVMSLVERRPPKELPLNPEEVLESLLAKIRDGSVKPRVLMIFYTEDVDGRIRPRTWSTNCTRPEAIALCQLEIQRNLEEWQS